MFKSVTEFAQALLVGRRFITADGDAEIYYAPNTHGSPFRIRARTGELDSPLNQTWREYDSVTETVPWHRRIPRQGVLCWVSDSKERPTADNGGKLRLIVKFTEGSAYPFETSGEPWAYARPVSADEILPYIAEEVETPYGPGG